MPSSPFGELLEKKNLSRPELPTMGDPSSLPEFRASLANGSAAPLTRQKSVLSRLAAVLRTYLRGKAAKPLSPSRIETHKWRPLAQDEEEALLKRLPIFFASAELSICADCLALEARRASQVDILYLSRDDLLALQLAIVGMEEQRNRNRQSLVSRPAEPQSCECE